MAVCPFVSAATSSHDTYGRHLAGSVSCFDTFARIQIHFGHASVHAQSCRSYLRDYCRGIFLLPTLGVRATIYTAAAINIVIGFVTIFVDRVLDGTGTEGQTAAGPKEESLSHREQDGIANDQDVGGPRFWLFCAFVSGFVTISAQVAWTRVLTTIIGSSTYAFTIVVSLFLVGMSAGSYLIGRKRYFENLRFTILTVELVTAGSLYLSLAIINVIPLLLVNTGLRFNVGSWGGLLLLQIFAAGSLILLPAFSMGTVMPLVLIWASKEHSSTSVQLVGVVTRSTPSGPLPELSAPGSS